MAVMLIPGSSVAGHPNKSRGTYPVKAAISNAQRIRPCVLIQLHRIVDEGDKATSHLVEFLPALNAPLPLLVSHPRIPQRLPHLPTGFGVATLQDGAVVVAQGFRHHIVRIPLVSQRRIGFDSPHWGTKDVRVMDRP